MYHYKRLRDLREDADLKQSDVAEIISDSQQHYQLYESGKREPPFWVIIKLAQHYKVSIDYIAGLTDDKGGLHKNNQEEQEVLTLYHNLSTKDKGRIIGRMEEILEKKIEPTNNVSIKGDNSRTTVHINSK